MSPFQTFIHGLSEDQLQQLAQGQIGLDCNESAYELGMAGLRLKDLGATPDAQRRHLIEQEQVLLEQLYQDKPLCREEFDYQAGQLLQQHGPHNFFRPEDQSWALMIDGSFLSAVPPEDVRSQYGYYCQGDEAEGEEQASAAVRQWLAEGTAFEDYQVKTHCRYFCR